MQTITTRVRNVDGSSVKVTVERYPADVSDYPYDAFIQAFIDEDHMPVTPRTDVRSMVKDFPFASVVIEALDVRPYELNLGHSYASGWTNL